MRSYGFSFLYLLLPKCCILFRSLSVFDGSVGICVKIVIICIVQQVTGGTIHNLQKKNICFANFISMLIPLLVEFVTLQMANFHKSCLLCLFYHHSREKRCFCLSSCLLQRVGKKIVLDQSTESKEVQFWCALCFILWGSIMITLVLSWTSELLDEFLLFVIGQNQL